jgi:hypothetical protein
VLPQPHGAEGLAVNNDTNPFICKANYIEVREHIKMKYASRRGRLIILICTSIVFGSICARPARSHKTKIPHLHVVQAHNVLGPMEIFAASGVSILRLQKLECSIFLDSRQKNPDVIVVAPKKRLYCQIPLNQFEYGLSRTLDTVSDLEMNPKQWKLVRRKQDAGLILSNYVYESTVRTYDEFSTFIPGRQENTPVTAELTTMQSALATPSFCLLLKKMEHVPDVSGVPIKMQTAYSKGRFRSQLSTARAEVIQMPSFSIPPLSGYKKTAKSSDIFFGQVNLIDNLLDKIDQTEK